MVKISCLSKIPFWKCFLFWLSSIAQISLSFYVKIAHAMYFSSLYLTNVWKKNSRFDLTLPTGTRFIISVNLNFRIFQRTKQKFQPISIAHFAGVLTVKTVFTYININPTLFQTATTSMILNLGIWIQTIVSTILGNLSEVF